MKYNYKKWKTGSMLPLFLLMMAALLNINSANAQDNFVGDGFGGRSWYRPGNIECGTSVTAANIGGQVYMWGLVNESGSPLVNRYPIAQPYTKINGIGVTTTLASAFVYPQSISSLNNVKLISLDMLGGAIKTDGTGWVWGTRGSTIYLPATPTQVISNCKHLSAGIESVSFVKNDGTVWSVGFNSVGEFGNGSTNSSTSTITPVQMTGITNAVRVSNAGGGPGVAGGTIVLKSDGTVWTCGQITSTAANLTAVQVAGLSNIVDIKGGQGFGIALTASGDVYEWGALAPHGGSGSSTNTPVKAIFPLTAAPIVAIESDPETAYYYALDENNNLYFANYITSDGILRGYGSGTTGFYDPSPAAHHVADINTNNTRTYLTRNSSYPADERLWVAGTFPLIDKLSNESIVETDGINGPWGPPTVSLQDAWIPARPSFGGIGPVDPVAGTINCAATQLYPAPVAGTPRQIDLVVTVNVTTAGCFSPITVSGSGFSLPAGLTQKCVTATGIQQLHIPVNYDGSALGTLNFTIGQAGACSADLTRPPSRREVNVWTLDNCTLVNVAPALR